MAEAQTTTDHKKIQEWVEQRGGKPACVRGTGGKGDTGLLRIDFPGYSGADSLQEIEWDEFFEKFEDQNLAFLYQETTADGDQSNFTKFVDRASVDGGRRGGNKKKAARGGSRGGAGGRSGKAAKKAAKTGGAKGGVKGTKTAKSAARKKSASSGKSGGGKKAAKKAATKAPKKSAGGMKKGTKKAAKKAGGRKKAAR